MFLPKFSIRRLMLVTAVLAFILIFATMASKGVAIGIGMSIGFASLAIIFGLYALAYWFCTAVAKLKL